jgi:N-hydroxyarylamine O-acetyltransferase
MGRVPSLDESAIFEKIVVQRRGGWCFEMNLLFAWVLRTIGMHVDIVGARIGKGIAAAPFSHIALIVHLEQPYLADVGFGNGFANPTPLREGSFNDGRFDFRLERRGDSWRFHNHREDGSTYDFTTQPCAPPAVAMANRSLATTSESPFVQNLICARLREDGMITLTNAALRVFSSREIKEETASTALTFERMLRDHFELETDRIGALWPRVADQQKRWLQRRLRGF